MTKTQAQKDAQKQAWATYEQACNARHSHVHVDGCRECWSTAGGNRNCLTWNILSARIQRTLDVWMNL